MGISRRGRGGDISQIYLTSEHIFRRVSPGTNALERALHHPTMPSSSVCFAFTLLMTGGSHLPHTAARSAVGKCRLAQSFSFFQGAIFHPVTPPGSWICALRPQKPPCSLYPEANTHPASLPNTPSRLQGPPDTILSLFLALHRDPCPSSSPNQLSIPGSLGSAGPE